MCFNVLKAVHELSSLYPTLSFIVHYQKNQAFKQPILIIRLLSSIHAKYTRYYSSLEHAKTLGCIFLSVAEI